MKGAPAPKFVFRNRVHSDNYNKRTDPNANVRVLKQTPGAEPFLFQDGDDEGSNIRVQSLSQAGYWQNFSGILYLLALLPGIGFGLYGAAVAGVPGLCAGLGAGFFFINSLLLSLLIRL